MLLKRSALALLGLFSLSTMSLASAPSKIWPIQTSYMPHEVLVTFKTVSPVQKLFAVQKIGGTILEEIKDLKLARVQIPSRLTPMQAAATMSRYPEVAHAGLNYLRKIMASQFIPNDPLYSKQYALPIMKVTSAWTLNTGDPTVVVAVLDNGTKISHPDLQGNLVAGYNFVNNTTDPSPTASTDLHGTWTAGCIAGVVNNGIGVAGVGFNSKVMPLCISTGEYLSSVNVIKGIKYAADHGANIISMSFGGYGNSQDEQDATDYAWSKGCALFASAGNDGVNIQTYPASYPHVVSVGASDSNDQQAYFSNYGSWVSVAAPGVGIWSTDAGGGYASVDGTSFSCPLTAGVASLVWSYGGKGTVTNSDVRAAIENTTDPVGSWVSHGRVDAYNALLAIDPGINEPGTPSTPSTPAGNGTVMNTGTNPLVTAGDADVYQVAPTHIAGLGYIAGFTTDFSVTPMSTAVKSGSISVNAMGTNNALLQVFAQKTSDSSWVILGSQPLSTSSFTFSFSLAAGSVPASSFVSSAGTVKLWVRALLPDRLASSSDTNFTFTVDQVSGTITYRTR